MQYKIKKKKKLLKLTQKLLMKPNKQRFLLNIAATWPLKDLLTKLYQGHEFRE